MATAMLKLGLLSAQNFMSVSVNRKAIDVADRREVEVERLRESEPVNKHKGPLFAL